VIELKKTENHGKSWFLLFVARKAWGRKISCTCPRRVGGSTLHRSIARIIHEIASEEQASPVSANGSVRLRSIRSSSYNRSKRFERIEPLERFEPINESAYSSALNCVVNFLRCINNPG
jgi:hypothetical protein